MGKAPGKLDHATVVAFEVGCYRGNQDEDYAKSDVEDDAFGSDVSSFWNVCESVGCNELSKVI